MPKEEIKINGNILSYQGRYSSDPGDKIKHTMVSNDGVNWTVYERNKWNLVIGIICTLVGLFLVVYGKKSNTKSQDLVMTLFNTIIISLGKVAFNSQFFP